MDYKSKERSKDSACVLKKFRIIINFSRNHIGYAMMNHSHKHHRPLKKKKKPNGHFWLSCHDLCQIWNLDWRCLEKTLEPSWLERRFIWEPRQAICMKLVTTRRHLNSGEKGNLHPVTSSPLSAVQTSERRENGSYQFGSLLWAMQCKCAHGLWH